jgi:hypothetical protein
MQATPNKQAPCRRFLAAKNKGRVLEPHGAQSRALAHPVSVDRPPEYSKPPRSGLPALSSANIGIRGPQIRPGRRRSHQGCANNQKARRENGPSTTARSPTLSFVFSERLRNSGRTVMSENTARLRKLLARQRCGQTCPAISSSCFENAVGADEVLRYQMARHLHEHHPHTIHPPSPPLSLKAWRENSKLTRPRKISLTIAAFDEGGWGSNINCKAG